MKYKILKEQIARATQKFISSEEAEYFATEVAETLIRKPDGHVELLHDLKNWQSNTGKVEKEIDLPGFTKYNFNGLCPSLKIKEIHDCLAAKAETNGISMVSVVNSGGMHAMHFWTQGLARRGLFALGAWNGGPDAVVPHNGTRGIFGTNPITYAFPGDAGDVRTCIL